MPSVPARQPDVIVVGSGRDARLAAAHARRAGLDVARVGAAPPVAGEPPTLEAFCHALAGDARRARGAPQVPAWSDVRRPLRLACRAVPQELTAPPRAVPQRAGAGREGGGDGSTVHVGPAELCGGSRVRLVRDDLVLQAPAIILASGTVPRGAPGLAVDGRVVGFADDILNGATAPRSVVILGGGETGAAMAGLLQRMGCAVTLVTRAPRLLRSMDAEVADAVAAALRRDGVALHLSSRLREITVTAAGVAARISARDGGADVPLRAERLLVATGERPRTTDLGLERTRAVRDKRGYVQVDSAMLSAEPGLYAVGGVVASRRDDAVNRQEIGNAVRHLRGGDVVPVRTMNSGRSLGGCHPALAAGLTEAAAKAAGHLVRIGRGRWGAGPGTGWLKLVFDAEERRMLGVHAFGAGVPALQRTTAALLACGSEADWSLLLTPDQRQATHRALAEATGDSAGGGPA